MWWRFIYDTQGDSDIPGATPIILGPPYSAGDD